MKYYFILNPVSGTMKQGNALLKEIRDTSENLGIDYEVYFTKYQKDATRFVREVCETGEEVRIYGCGGDGTVNELVNGAYGFPNAEIGVIPQGTGNDYIRNYGEPKDFLNIENQILGESKYSDLIKYTAEYEGEITEGYCANMFNIGFDCNVVDMTDKVKSWPMFSGSSAYLASIFIVLAKLKKISLKAEFSNGEVRDGRVLMISIANGSFCGGGIKSAPQSILDDGLMDVSVVKDVITRSKFLRLFPAYKAGKHLDNKKFESVLEYRKEERMTLTANDEFLRLCVDGEVSTQKKVEFEMVQDAFKFIVPKGL